MLSPLKLYSEQGYNSEAYSSLPSTFKRGQMLRSILICGPHRCGKSTALQGLFNLSECKDSVSGGEALVWPEASRNEWRDVLVVEAATNASAFDQMVKWASVCLLVFTGWEDVACIETKIRGIVPKDPPKLLVLIEPQVSAHEWHKSQREKHFGEESPQILERSDLDKVRKDLLEALSGVSREWSIEEICDQPRKPIPYFHPCFYVNLEQCTPLRLLSITPSAGLTLNEETLSILCGNFKDCPSICPFVMLGHAQCGKSILLDEVLGVGSKFSSISEGEGLWVWPHPLNSWDGKSVLLMEISGLTVIERDDSVDKLTVIAMTLSAVCGVCLERSSFFPNLRRILELGGIANAFLSSPSKYLVFPELSDMKKQPWIIEKDGIVEKHPNLIFLGRSQQGRVLDLISPIKSNISDCSKDYQSITVPQELPGQHIMKLASFAKLCTEIANTTVDLADYKRRFEWLKTMFETDMKRFEKFRYWRESLRELGALNYSTICGNLLKC